VQYECTCHGRVGGGNWPTWGNSCHTTAFDYSLWVYGCRFSKDMSVLPCSLHLKYIKCFIMKLPNFYCIMDLLHQVLYHDVHTTDVGPVYFDIWSMVNYTIVLMYVCRHTCIAQGFPSSHVFMVHSLEVSNINWVVIQFDSPVLFSMLHWWNFLKTLSKIRLSSLLCLIDKFDEVLVISWLKLLSSNVESDYMLI
jgi:hypothetical protein